MQVQLIEWSLDHKLAEVAFGLGLARNYEYIFQQMGLNLMEQSITKFSKYRDIICRKIGSHIEICLHLSQEGDAVALIINDIHSTMIIISNEVANIFGRSNHSELFIALDHVEPFQKKLLISKKLSGITAFSSPLSQNEVSALLFLLLDGSELFVSGADMPLTLAIKMHQQYWGQSEFSNDEYEVLWQED